MYAYRVGLTLTLGGGTERAGAHGAIDGVARCGAGARDSILHICTRCISMYVCMCIG